VARIANTTDLCLGSLLGAPDRGYAMVEARETVRGLVAGLPERDRRLLALRYGEGWTQTMIATEIGTFQMQVSRSLARIMTKLRATICLGDDPAVA
jgi:RNA polymerase sigma-B factor